MNNLKNNVDKVRHASRKMVRELGLLSKNPSNDWPISFQHVLIELNSNGLLSQIELSRLLNLEKSTISRLLKSMLKQKLILETINQNDQRYKYISLTPQGRKLHAKINTLAESRVNSALAQLTEAQRTSVASGMELYAYALKLSRIQNEYSIRAIQKKDNKPMADIISKVLKEYKADKPGTAFEDEELDDLYKAYTKGNAAYFIIENKRNKKIVGGCGIGALLGSDEQICELKKMYFLPEVRGLGLGNLLLQKVLESANNFGYKQCYLETLSHMTSALKLYESFGFQRLDSPLGNTGHYSCDVWLVKNI